MGRGVTRPLLAAAGAALITAACGASLPEPAFERFDPTVIPRVTDYPDVPAVVLLDRGTLFLGVDGSGRNPLGRLRRYRRVLILRPDGVSHARQELPFDPGTTIYGLRARVVSPDGRTVERSGGDVQDALHPDGRPQKVVSLPGVVPGAVIELTYDQYLRDLKFLEPWAFQSAIPTRRSELTVVVPPGFVVDLRFSEQGTFVDRPPERFETDQGTRFSWSRSNLPALFREEDMPSPELLAPRAHVIFVSARIEDQRYDGFGSWDTVGEWFVRRIPEGLVVSDANAAEARRVAGDSPPEEKALKLMEVLARDLPEEPGPPPPLWRVTLASPDAILRKRAANPTTRGILFVALLRAAGVPADLGLFAYRDRDTILPDLPTVRALTGVCAVIPRPEGPLVLDPSQLTLSTDVPSPRLQGSRLVVVSGETSEVLRVPTSLPEHSVASISYDVQIDERGDLFGEMQGRLTGAEAGALRDRLRGSDPSDYAKIVSGFVRSRGGGLDVESVSIADLGALRRPLSLKGQVRLAGLINSEETELELRVGRFTGAAMGGIREVRRSPRTLPAPSQRQIRVTLTLPETWEVQEVPEATNTRWEGGEVTLVTRKETTRRLGFLRTEVLRATEIAPRLHRSYVRFSRAVNVGEDDTASVLRPAPRELEF